MSVCTRAYERREQIPFAHVAAVLCFPEVKSSGVSGTDATPGAREDSLDISILGDAMPTGRGTWPVARSLGRLLSRG
jgi:hypothetical protein